MAIVFRSTRRRTRLGHPPSAKPSGRRPTTIWYGDGPGSPRTSPRHALAAIGLADEGAPDVTLGLTVERHPWIDDPSFTARTLLAGYALSRAVNEGRCQTTRSSRLTRNSSSARCSRLASVGRELGDDRVEVADRVALDDAVTTETKDRHARLLHRPGQRGTGELLRQLAAVPHEGRLPDSWIEELVRLCLVDTELPPVVRRHEIRDDRGRFVARVDLAIPSVRLGLEAHSRRFHIGPDAEAVDEQRDLRVAACGWELVYSGGSRRPVEVLAMVKQIVAARTSK